MRSSQCPTQKPHLKAPIAFRMSTQRQPSLLPACWQSTPILGATHPRNPLREGLLTTSCQEVITGRLLFGKNKEKPLSPHLLWTPSWEGAWVWGCHLAAWRQNANTEGRHAWAIMTSLGHRTNREVTTSVLLSREIITCLVYTAVSQISGDL